VWKPGRKKFLKGGQTAAACCSGGGGAGAPGQDRGQLDRGIIRRTPGGSLAQLAAAFAAGGNAMSSFQGTDAMAAAEAAAQHPPSSVTTTSRDSHETPQPPIHHEQQQQQQQQQTRRLQQKQPLQQHQQQEKQLMQQDTDLLRSSSQQPQRQTRGADDQHKGQGEEEEPPAVNEAGEVIRPLEERLPGPDWRERCGPCGIPADERRASPIVELSLLLAECVQHGRRTLAFCKTRKLCELVTAYTRETLRDTAPHLAHSISVYRGGYSPQVRFFSHAAFPRARVMPARPPARLPGIAVLALIFTPACA